MGRRQERPTAGTDVLRAMHASTRPSLSVVELMLTTGRSLGSVYCGLLALEVQGQVRADPPGRYRPTGRRTTDDTASGAGSSAGRRPRGELAEALGDAPTDRPGRFTRYLVELALGRQPYLIAARHRQELLDALGQLPDDERWIHASTALRLRRQRLPGCAVPPCRFGRHDLVLHRDDSGGYLECVRCGTEQNLLFHTVS